MDQFVFAGEHLSTVIDAIFGPDYDSAKEMKTSLTEHRTVYERSYEEWNAMIEAHATNKDAAEASLTRSWTWDPCWRSSSFPNLV